MVNINCPVAGGITITGTGTLEVEQTSTVDLGAADAVFELSVDPVTFSDYFIKITHTDDSAQDNTFTLLGGWAVTLGVALTTAEADATTLAAATDADNQYHPFNSDHKNLGDYLKNWAQVNINGTLNADNIGAFLSAEEIKDLAITDLGAAFVAAVNGLKSDLSADEAAKKAIAHQFTNSRWKSGNGDATDPKKLPFEAGDSLTFRFNVTSDFTISYEQLPAPDTTAAHANEDQPGEAGSNAPVGTYLVPFRAVNVVLKFAAGARATVAADGEAAASA
jgi:hypothetical protein